MPRPQFTLKSLQCLVLVVVCFFTAVRWHSNRLPVLADRFNALVHQHRYTDADAVATKMRQLYPNELLPKLLEGFCRILLNKKRPPYPEPVWNPDELATWQKLADERRARMKAENANPAGSGARE